MMYDVTKQVKFSINYHLLLAMFMVENMEKYLYS